MNQLTSIDNSSASKSQVLNGDFGDIIDYCKMIPSVDELHKVLCNPDFPMSQKNGEQVIIDLVRGFFRIGRKDGTHYIDHLIQTLKNTEIYDDTFDTDSVLIALLHDSIEDTEETFESIRLKYGDTVALGVQALSKKPFWEYIPKWNLESNLWTEEARNFSDVKESIQSHIGKEIDHDFKLSDHSQLPIELKQKWEEYEEKYKIKRNEDYFSKFDSLETLRKSLQEEAGTQGIEISEEDLEYLTIKVATIKLSDRLHNLLTLPAHKIEGKIKETLKYLKNIGKELGGRVWGKISQEILYLLRRKYNGSAIEIV